MKASLKIGTRQSLLALWQSNYIAACLRKEYPECEVTLKKIVTKGDKIIIRGCGWGHGAGLCQEGAQGRALAGQNYARILKHYYPGAILSK